MDIAQIGAAWLHALGMVVVVGYYAVLGLVTIPALERSLDEPQAAAALVAIERRALPFVSLSVVAFIATGAYLLFTNPQYTGLGNVFASTWTTVMLVKHGLIVVFVALGVSVDFFARELQYELDDAQRATALRRVRLSAGVATAMGALVLLLTAAAQLSV